MSEFGLGRVKTLWRKYRGVGAGSDARSFLRLSLCPHCRHERLDAHDVHDAREIVGQHVQRHL